ncbi:MAG: YebC/PmpR family DNA-binding transcriptional regulator [Spirochaetaceae bacterium]|nr:MAG: YebC/PmpR family DNA-binding transcriptional regulator [Spirochaetaceae bacterium]
MSGHSKWATIRHKKGALDAKRGKIFSKLIKEITVAARIGGADADSNPRLRTAINKARIENMPKDNIERAIKKGSGDMDGADYSEIVYEGYGPGGVAILVECLTDNRNRTAADVRSIFNKAGGNLGESGCVSYLFNKKGIIVYSADKYTEDDILEKALEAGAGDVAMEGDAIEVETAVEDFDAVVEAMQAAGLEHESAEVSLVADTYSSLDEEGTRKVLKMLETLDDHDDVQNVSSNLDIPDDFQLD